jgi:flagellar biosynthesis protein FliR
MSIEVSAAWGWSLLLCGMRLLPLLAFTPLLNGFTVPQRVKTVLIMVLAACLVSATGVPQAGPPPGMGAVVKALVMEFLAGSAMSLGLQAVFAAYSLAGGLIDLQMGFALGAIYDPVSRKASPLLSSALGTMALTSFFSLDLHHDVLRAFAQGLLTAPLGMATMPLGIEQLLERFAGVFALGLAMAAPVVFLLFLVDLGFAVMSRSIPQLNVLFLGIPVKILLGLAGLSLLLPHWAPTLARAMRQLFVGASPAL